MKSVLTFPKNLLLTMVDTAFYTTVLSRTVREALVFLVLSSMVIGLVRSLGFASRYYTPLQGSHQEVVNLLSDVPVESRFAIRNSTLELDSVPTPLSVGFTPSLASLFNPTGLFDSMLIIDPDHQASSSAKAWVLIASDSAWFQTGTMNSRQVAFSELTGDTEVTGSDLNDLRTYLEDARPWLVRSLVGLVFVMISISTFITGLISALVFGYVLKVIGTLLRKIHSYRQGLKLALHLEVFALVATAIQTVVAPYATYSVYMVALLLATSFVVVSLPKQPQTK